MTTTNVVIVTQMFDDIREREYNLGMIVTKQVLSQGLNQTIM